MPFVSACVCCLWLFLFTVYEVWLLFGSWLLPSRFLALSHVHHFSFFSPRHNQNVNGSRPHNHTPSSLTAAPLRYLSDEQTHGTSLKYAYLHCNPHTNRAAVCSVASRFLASRSDQRRHHDITQNHDDIKPHASRTSILRLATTIGSASKTSAYLIARQTGARRCLLSCIDDTTFNIASKNLDGQHLGFDSTPAFGAATDQPVPPPTSII